MSKFKISPAAVNSLADSFNTPESKLKSASDAMAQIAADLKRFSSTASVGSSADLVAEQLNTSAHAVNRFRTAVIAGATVYSNAENTILSRETENIPDFAPYEKYNPLPVPAAPEKTKKEEEEDGGWQFKGEGSVGKEFGYVFSHNGTQFDGAKHYSKGIGKNNKSNWTDVTNADDYATAPGENWYNRSTEFGASIGAGIGTDGYGLTLAGKLVGPDKNGASVGIGHYELQASIGAQAGRVYDEQNHKWINKFGAGVSAGASISIIGAEAHGHAGSETYNVGGRANVDIGKVEATGALNIGLWDDGFSPSISLAGTAGAYLVSAEVGVSGTVMGIKGEASAGFKVGLAANGQFSYKDGKLECAFGASLGIGFEIKFNVDFSGVTKGVSEAVDAIGNAAKSVGNAVSNAAGKVKDAVTGAFKGAAKSVANFFKSWF